MRSVFKTLLERLISSLSRSATNGPGPLRALSAFALNAIDDRRVIRTSQGHFTMRTGNPIERWRADTLLTKEPETIAWLDETIDADSVFYDVGANVGVYTLYATHRFPGQVRAVCIEPEALNFARLNRNIADNGLSGKVICFPVGLGEQAGAMALTLSVLEAGRALHGDRFVTETDAAHRQGVIVEMLDGLIERADFLPRPTHLKIDVDGPELNILRGAAKTLADPVLRHVLVELTSDETDEAIRLLGAYGFKVSATGETASDMTNYIFRKLEGKGSA